MLRYSVRPVKCRYKKVFLSPNGHGNTPFGDHRVKKEIRNLMKLASYNNAAVIFYNNSSFREHMDCPQKVANRARTTRLLSGTSL